MTNSKIKFVESISTKGLEKKIEGAADFYPGYIVTDVDKRHICMGKFDGFVAMMTYGKI